MSVLCFWLATFVLPNESVITPRLATIVRHSKLSPSQKGQLLATLVHLGDTEEQVEQLFGTESRVGIALAQSQYWHYFELGVIVYFDGFAKVKEVIQDDRYIHRAGR